MGKISSLISFGLLLFMCSCEMVNNEPKFLFIENEKGVELTENGKKVFFYQKEVVPIWENPAISEDALFNHYIHPLYSLSGDTITEAQPVNDIWHLHQRGIFWAWHQIFMGDSSLGDGWIMKDIRYDIVNIETSVQSNIAKLKLQVNWISFKNDTDLVFIKEYSTIKVYPSDSNKRIIDFEINLRAKVPKLCIIGSLGKKGYGGFSTRIKLPNNILFRSETGNVEPQINQTTAGAWVDIYTEDSLKKEDAGLIVMANSNVQNTQSQWILRIKNSMQNAVFPGVKPYYIGQNEPLTLKYRLVVHEGKKLSINTINNWYNKYTAN